MSFDVTANLKSYKNDTDEMLFTVNDNDYAFLFTDSHDVLFDKRMIWFFGLNC